STATEALFRRGQPSYQRSTEITESQPPKRSSAVTHSHSCPRPAAFYQCPSPAPVESSPYNKEFPRQNASFDNTSMPVCGRRRSRQSSVRHRRKALFREKTFPVFTLPTEVSLHADVTLIIAIAATID
ncbi:hypothetical protein E4U50_000879, partial [Claviceps purpurea]